MNQSASISENNLKLFSFFQSIKYRMMPKCWSVRRIAATRLPSSSPRIWHFSYCFCTFVDYFHSINKESFRAIIILLTNLCQGKRREEKGDPQGFTKKKLVMIRIFYVRRKFFAFLWQRRIERGTEREREVNLKLYGI